ncbi:MAG: phosphatase PAP2 family protein [Planctomycetes bacterium]|nr:phosphatase PAP2 family protein [Planctomycetota bacterium]
MRNVLLALGLLAAGTWAGGCADINVNVMRDRPPDGPASMSAALAALGPSAVEPAASLPGRSDAVESTPSWLEMGRLLAASPAEAGKAPATRDGQRAGKLPYVPYAQRRGPAYPGDVWRSLGRDGKEFLPMIWDDTKATVTNPVSLVLLGMAAGGVALFGNNGDDQVARHFTEHGSQLNTFWDSVGDAGGNPGTHFAVAGAMYFTGLIAGDTKTYEVSKTMLSALAVNGLTTLVLKAALRTESPNGDENGWPSGHTSSTFCMATVLNESYGPWVGIPAYAFAAFVGYERIDARNHDFSDVISGALLGIAIGHAISQNHKPKILGMDVVPYTDPRGGVGLALCKQW